jgi:hypothetical protein
VFIDRDRVEPAHRIGVHHGDQIHHTALTELLDGFGEGRGNTRDGNTYVLKSNETEELKVVLQADSSLRDESGNIWRLESRSRSFRPPDQDLASQ